MAPSFSETMLFLVVACAFYPLMIIPFQNGLFEALMALKKPGAILPGSPPTPVEPDYTGIRSLDKAIVPMVGFFWPAFDGMRADVSLVTFELVGQFAAAWILIAVETWRVGQKQGWAIPAATITGLLLQFIGFAIVPPIWMVFHLRYSPTVKAVTAGPLTLLNPLPLLTIPVSTFLAVGVPNIFIFLTSAVNSAPPAEEGPIPPLTSSTDSSAINSPSAKQFYAALSQLWAVSFGAAQLFLPVLVSVVTSKFIIFTEHAKKVKSRKYSTWCYYVAMLIGTISHWTYLLLPMLAHTFPLLVQPTYQSQLRPSVIFMPAPIDYPPPAIKTVADGVFAFVQWDLILGSLAVLIWTGTLRVQAQWAVRSHLHAHQWAAMFLKTAVLVLLCGPSAAAAGVMWYRDRLIFERDMQP